MVKCQKRAMILANKKIVYSQKKAMILAKAIEENDTVIINKAEPSSIRHNSIPNDKQPDDADMKKQLAAPLCNTASLIDQEDAEDHVNLISSAIEKSVVVDKLEESAIRHSMTSHNWL